MSSHRSLFSGLFFAIEYPFKKKDKKIRRQIKNSIITFTKHRETEGGKKREANKQKGLTSKIKILDGRRPHKSDFLCFFLVIFICSSSFPPLRTIPPL